MHNIHYQHIYIHMYGISEIHNRNTCLRHFGLLEMAWHLPQTSDCDAISMCSVISIKCNLQCPKFKIQNRIYKIFSIRRPKYPTFRISIITLWIDWKYFACSIIHYWNDAKCSTGGRIAIWALQQNDRMVWCKVQYLVIWYHIENRFHFYKSCLLILKFREIWSWNFDKHDLYK